MFGIMFFLFMGICGILAACRMAVMDMQMYNIQRQDPDDDFEDYWMSASGKMISRKTHRECMKSNYLGVKGHDCLVDCKTLNVIKDYTQEKNDRVRDLVLGADNPGITAYMTVASYEKSPSKIKGDRYIDIKTGDMLVVRDFKVASPDGERLYCSFFMSLKNGHLIRLTDKCLEDRKFNDTQMKHINFYIQDFNMKQDVDIQNKGNDDFESHFYFNKNASFDLKINNIYHEENLCPQKVTYSH